MNKEMNVYGLTGNMGCGKSTVGEFLQKKHPDVYLFDCDKVAKDLLSDSENTEEIKKILGDDVFDNQKINRQKVAKLIFNNYNKKQAFEEFIHPLVWKKLAEEIQKVDEDKIFIVESAIFYEIGKEKDISKVIVVACNPNEQINRIKKRNGWSDDQIEERLKYQIPNDIKTAKALVVIDTNCSMQELELKVERLYSFLKSNESCKLVL
jgi:dephospho-CoA kinase